MDFAISPCTQGQRVEGTENNRSVTPEKHFIDCRYQNLLCAGSFRGAPLYFLFLPLFVILALHICFEFEKFEKCENCVKLRKLEKCRGN